MTTFVVADDERVYGSFEDLEAARRFKQSMHLPVDTKVLEADTWNDVTTPFPPDVRIEP